MLLVPWLGSTGRALVSMLAPLGASVSPWTVVTMLEEVCLVPRSSGIPEEEEDPLQWFEISKAGPGWERELCVLWMS